MCVYGTLGIWLRCHCRSINVPSVRRQGRLDAPMIRGSIVSIGTKVWGGRGGCTGIDGSIWLSQQGRISVPSIMGVRDWDSRGVGRRARVEVGGIPGAFGGRRGGAAARESMGRIYGRCAVGLWTAHATTKGDGMRGD